MSILEHAKCDIRLDLILIVSKLYHCHVALRDMTLETISSCFLPDEWLQIYTDGYLLDFSQSAISGDFSAFLSTCLKV